MKHKKNGTDIIGMIELRFDDYKQQRSFVEHIEENIYVEVIHMD